MYSEQVVNTNLGGAISKKPRSSNLELYRIMCMLMIVAHHYVVNSGLTSTNGPLMTDYNSCNSVFLILFGAWGKTGINCFLLITGYFMCSSKITVRKFLKLLGQLYLYRLIFFVVFFITGYENVTFLRMIRLLMPFWSFGQGFVSCFIGFWLYIPFLSILVQNMNRRQHQLLLLLSLGFYTLFGTIPMFEIDFNYMSWFCILFFIASYFRLHPQPFFEERRIWGKMTLLCFILACASIILMRLFFGEKTGLGYKLVEDCNKLFAVMVAVCSFLWFKNMNIRYSKVINAFGAGTFGVFLIHANSSAMRTWLWKDTVDVVGHYNLPFYQLVLFSTGVVLAIFIVCNLIDQLRIATLEKWFFNWYDKKWSAKADAFISRIISL